MIDYDVVFHRTAVSFLLGRPPRERRLLLQFLDGLHGDPFQTGDFELTDRSGRQHFVKRIGAIQVTFWPDHPAKEVHITEITKL